MSIFQSLVNKLNVRNKYLFAIITVCCGLYLICGLLVGYYYQHGLPYYDSVGSYWNMFSVMNITRDEGILNGIFLASTDPLSWLQSFFAVFASYIFPRSPDWLISLNFMLLLITLLFIFNAVKSLKFPSSKAYVLSLLFLAPGALFGWQGGIIDMRRDIQILLLLKSAFYGVFIFLQKPNFKKGIMSGILLGLVQWSRGNAFPYILIILFSLYFAYYQTLKPKKLKLKSIKLLMVPVFVMLILLLPFYLVIGKVAVERYFLTGWAFGYNRLNSIVAFFKTIPMIILGPTWNVVWFNSILLIFHFVLFLLALKNKYIFINKSWFMNKSGKMLFISGILSLTLVFIFNTLVIGVGEVAGIFPNFPILVGTYTIVLYILCGISLNKSANISKNSILIGLPIIILLISFVRVWRSMPPIVPELHDQAKKIASDLSPLFLNKKVSYVWLDHVHVHDLNFYITQLGGSPISARSRLTDVADIEMPPNPLKTIDEQRKAYADGIRTRQYIVVNNDLSAYANSSGFFFILMHGKPVVEDILKDVKLIPVYSFKYQNKSFTVLQNTYL